MKDFKDNADVASVGLEMGGCVAVGYFMGSWLDGQFGTEPWGTAFFLVCGLGAAVKGVLRVLRKARRISASEDTVPSTPVGAGSFQGYGT